jgi:hypothetical protein
MPSPKLSAIDRRMTPGLAKKRLYVDEETNLHGSFEKKKRMNEGQVIS